MIDLCKFPRLIRLLSYRFRVAASLKRRNAGTKQAARHRTSFYCEAWKEAARRLRATYRHLGDEIFEFRLGRSTTRVCRNHTAIDDPVTLAIAGNKPLVHRLLARQNIPVPRHDVFTLNSIRLAVEFLERTARSCVVKPAQDTGGGAGVTTGVRTKTALAVATAAAAAHGSELLIEEQVDGDTYRLLYLDGTLLDAVIRRPPTVLGDGKSTVIRLVELANVERLKSVACLAQVLITLDLDMRQTLAKQGLRLSSIPEPGAVVRLKTVANENSSAENESAAHLLCPSIIATGAQSAAIVGSRLAGIDVVTADASLPLAQSGGVVLEVNTTPGFYYHYCKRDGRFPVAVHVLETLLGSPPWRLRN